MTEYTKTRSPRMALVLVAIGIVTLVAAGGGGFWLGTHRTPATAVASAAEDSRRVLYWYDPMVPAQHFDHAGKSPFMDMQLVARYAGDTQAETGVRVDAGVAQNLGVRLASVVRGPISRSVTAAGVIAFNGRDVAIVQARAGGFVERSHRRALGDVVAAGAPLVNIRVPEWTAAQAEYLAVRTGGDTELARAARQRLVMLGMPASLIARIEADGAPRPVFTVTAPIGGAITALDVREGMTITPGAALATISGVSPVWLIVSVPQASAGMVERGGRVSATLTAYPGEVFTGRIESVLPAADLASRTVEVRIALANPGGRLRPGMTAQAQLSDEAPRQALLVPSEAVIRTGQRNIIITALDGGRYAPVEVVLGDSAGGSIEIRQGLSEGQRIVVSGQFLIDSEASLSGIMAQLAPGAPSASAPTMLEGAGRITALDANGVTLAHGPVAALSWPAMTMEFGLARPDIARGLAVGDSVTFRFHQGGAGYVVDHMTKTGNAP